MGFKVKLETVMPDLPEFRAFLDTMNITEDSDDRVLSANKIPECTFRARYADTLQSMISAWWGDKFLWSLIVEDTDFETNPGNSPEYWESLSA